jgi:hypothetical protein
MRAAFLDDVRVGSRCAQSRDSTACHTRRDHAGPDGTGTGGKHPAEAIASCLFRRSAPMSPNVSQLLPPDDDDDLDDNIPEEDEDEEVEQDEEDEEDEETWQVGPDRGVRKAPPFA